MITYRFSSRRGEVLEVLDSPRAGMWVDVVKPTPDELLQLVSDLGLDQGILNDALDFYEVPRLERSKSAVYFFTRYVRTQTDIGVDTAPLLLVVGEGFVVTLSLVEAPFLDVYRDGERSIATFEKTSFLIGTMKLIVETYEAELTRMRRSVNRARTELRKIRNRNIERLVEHENELNDVVNALVPTNIWLKQILSGNYIQLYAEESAQLEDATIANNQLIDSATSILKASQNIRSAYESILTNNLNTAIRMLAAFTILLTIPMTIASLYGMNVQLPLANHPFAFWFILGFISLLMGSTWFYFSRRRWL
jgi:magnesium transporter